MSNTATVTKPNGTAAIPDNFIPGMPRPLGDADGQPVVQIDRKTFESLETQLAGIRTELEQATTKVRNDPHLSPEGKASQLDNLTRVAKAKAKSALAAAQERLQVELNTAQANAQHARTGHVERTRKALSGDYSAYDAITVQTVATMPDRDVLGLLLRATDERTRALLSHVLDLRLAPDSHLRAELSRLNGDSGAIAQWEAQSRYLERTLQTVEGMVADPGAAIRGHDHRAAVLNQF